MPLAILLTNPDGSPMTAMELFHAGKFIMWPILIVSFLLITVVIERVLFIVRENRRREPELVDKMLEKVESNDIDGAVELGKKSQDYVARILVYALTTRSTRSATPSPAPPARKCSASARVSRRSTPASLRPLSSASSAP